jgi:hypothetical protein
MELSLLAHIFVKTSLLIFCLITYCVTDHTNLHGVTVVPSFFDRVIIIGCEISIFILLRGSRGGGDHVGNIHCTLRHSTLPFDHVVFLLITHLSVNMIIVSAFKYFFMVSLVVC